MRIAVYGGSFNPPHVGHGMVVAWLLWTRRADAVWLVPVYRHAFEGVHDKSLAPFEARLTWCRAMAAQIAPPGDPRVSVLDIEARLAVPSYTIDTLRHLAAAHPDDQFFPVVGADVVPQLPHWREWSSLRRDFPPLVVGRPGFDLPDDSVVFPDVSSSDIRRRLRDGRSVAHLLPAAVAASITQADAVAWWGPQGVGT